MNILTAEKSLIELGVDFTKKGEVLNVKLGGYTNKILISYDLSKKTLSYKYYQTLMVLIALLMLVSSIWSIGLQHYFMSGIELATAMGVLISSVITEIKVTDLKRYIREYKQ